MSPQTNYDLKRNLILILQNKDRSFVHRQLKMKIGGGSPSITALKDAKTNLSLKSIVQ